MAEEISKRVDQLREDLTQQQAASITLLDIVKDIDKTTTSTQAHQTIIDARLGAVEARLSAVDARVSALSQDVIASARQNEQRMSRIEDKLDQVISLLTKGE